jgi:glycosyltransferase involved in cell wall biosynthesis
MRIFQLAPRLPYPLTDGGAIGIFKPTEAIARLNHDITFVSYPDSQRPVTEEARKRMSEFCRLELVAKPLPSTSSVLLKTMLSGAYPIERRMMPEMFSLIKRLLDEHSYDVVHLDSAHMGKYGLWIKERYDIPVILREHNYETLIYKRFADNERNPLKKMVARIHGNRLRIEEARFIRNLDATIAITAEDEHLLRLAVPDAKYYSIPAGVDTDYYRATDEPQTPNSILWIGGTNWRPNLDAIEFFAKEILPLVVKTIPEVTFDIVGENTDRLQHLTSSGVSTIRLHGRVPDIRPYMARAALMVCPLRVGGGMRLKLLDFFAAGKAVVSTHIGAEGNLARDGEQILLRDDPQAFAEAVVLLLQDQSLRNAIGERARVLAETEYSWNSIGKRFITVYEQVRRDYTSRRKQG